MPSKSYINICPVIYIYIYIYPRTVLFIYVNLVDSVHQSPQRTGFNPRSSHAKHSKNVT